ncbi:hypothetical protein PVAP13_7KG143055 [Panicum virgatum]|uniref:Uncharacterized protein n=1 Tax=Panicum virgatum TaxID=38727 RepID=A0A8T0QMR6_PANVG|nr:hypothetical protein PVAP13_7KG143055 [Panicum virgatum]
MINPAYSWIIPPDSLEKSITASSNLSKICCAGTGNLCNFQKPPCN